MDELALAEYRTLRHTIAIRGSLRAALMVGGMGLWASTLLAVLVLMPNPVAASIPLLVLAATFEGLRSLHMSSERIGRYLQAYFEEKIGGRSTSEAPPAWEHSAMAIGGRVPGASGHPLFLPLFVMATLLNLLAVLLPEPVPIELVLMSVAHLSFGAWLLYVDGGVRRQRARELEWFRRLRAQRAQPD